MFSQDLSWCGSLADTGVFVGHIEVCVPQFLPLGSMRACHVFGKSEMASIRWYFFFTPFLLFENFVHACDVFFNEIHLQYPPLQ